MTENLRPTKKQRELLSFIEGFISQHGYSPSYREVMTGLQYNSVATVALHINSLIKRGHLQKRDHSARSLEVIQPKESVTIVTNQIKPGEEKWLIEKVEYFFKEVESAPVVVQTALDQLYVLVGSLKVLGLDGAAQSFVPRISSLKSKLDQSV